MALTHVWITRGPNAGRTLMMTEADAAAAMSGNWASDHEMGATLTDEEYAENAALEVDWDSYKAYQDKTDDPTYSPQGEDDGSWTAPVVPEIDHPDGGVGEENIPDNTLPAPEPEVEAERASGSHSAKHGKSHGKVHVGITKHNYDD